MRLYPHLILILVLLGLVSPIAWGQNRSKADRLFSKAVDKIRSRQHDDALPILEEALQADSTLAEAAWQLGNLYRMYQRKTESSRAYRLFLRHIPTDEPRSINGALFLARQAAKEGDYALVEEAIDLILNSPASSSADRAEAESLAQRGNFIKEGMGKGALKLNMEPLPAPMNRFTHQYYPSITADGKLLVFTAQARPQNEDIYFSRWENGAWQKPEPFTEFAGDDNQGSASISGDGRTMVFCDCMGQSNGNCDLFISTRQGETWSEPENLNTINSPGWDTQPSLSADGQTLYFTSARRGGYGGSDIWMSQRVNDSLWGPPVNLGPTINTSGDESGPYIHANGVSLFFSSKGHPSLGSGDLFVSHKDSSGWKAAQNLGYPLNTQENESSICLAADGKVAYFTRQELDERGRVLYKIWKTNVPSEWGIKNAAGYLSGRVRQAGSLKPLAARLRLVDLNSQQTAYQIQADPSSGLFLLAVPKGRRYGVFVQAEGHLPQSLELKGQDSTEKADIRLEPLRKGARTRLDNLFFPTGAWDLQAESRSTLDLVLKLLQANPQLRVEISGHTDNVGTPASNQNLSQKRAQSVVQWLTTAGIPAQKLVAKGYGETRPAASNTTEAGRAQNRRIELQILD